MVFLHWLKFVFCFPVILALCIKDKKKRGKKHPHLFGVYGFFGLPGKGKTMTMCYKLRELREFYGDRIYITSNFGYKDEDFPFTSWSQLLEKYDRPLIVAWDEVQNVFQARSYSTFPVALLSILTQCRKGNGIQILYTSQRYTFVDKYFRELSFGCYECNTYLGRFTIAKQYDVEYYKAFDNSVSVDRRAKIRPDDVISFIQDDSLRESYDSYKMLDSALRQQYMTPEEVKKCVTV